MLNRQDSLLSSSRRQAATPEIHHAKSIGCMSGIIHLFSKYQNSNRRLTFGRKHEKRKTLQSATKAKRSEAVEGEGTDETERVTCGVKVPRSPTIPSEIRRSSSETSPDDLRTPSSLVVRLMGLEDDSAAVKKVAIEEIDPISKKRRRLLQALEKCNEDLEALKRIIKALQAANVVHLDQPPSGGGNACPMEAGLCVKECTDVVADAPNIPAGTLDQLARSLRGVGFVAQDTIAGEVHVTSYQECKSITAKKPGVGNDELPIAKLLLNKSITFAADISLLMRRRMAAWLPPRSSRAMVRSVEEVCRDIAWGERREINRIGLVLEDHVYRELIEELVKEMVAATMTINKKESCSVVDVHLLPLEACKRRLCF